MANYFNNGLYTFEKSLLLLVICLKFCLLVTGQINNTIHIRMNEELPANTLIGDIASLSGIDKVIAEDIRNQFRYSILSSGPNTLFDIAEGSGLLKTASKIDRDKICPQQVICRRTIEVAVRPAAYFRVITVNIDIDDLNDNEPTFEETVQHIKVPESTQVEKVIALLPMAKDPDSGLFGIQTYKLLDDNGEHSRVFKLRENIGLDGASQQELILKEELDRESKGSYKLKLFAYDGGKTPKSGVLLINVTVEDNNDNRPFFEVEDYQVNVQENISISAPILNVTAYDKDIGPNGQVVYGFTAKTNETGGSVFRINESTGQIFLRKKIDFEVKDAYRLVVTAKDQGPNTQTAQVAVLVRVKDINDCKPEISVDTLTLNGRAEIIENQKPETFIAFLRVSDKDSGIRGQVECGINYTDNFKLLSMEGSESKFQLVSKTKLDREEKSSYTVKLSCSDKGPGNTSLSSSKILTIHVLDDNDHNPVFKKSVYRGKFEENNSPDEYVLTVSATDADEGANAKIKYYILSENSDILEWFRVEETTGVLRAKGQLDHEKYSSVIFHIGARDNGSPISRNSTTRIDITITDINDNKPKFTAPVYSFAVPENQLPGLEVGYTIATDADSDPYNKITYRLLADKYNDLSNFQINPKTGLIRTRAKLDREVESQYYFKVEAFNANYTYMSSTASITIHVSDLNDNAPVIAFPTTYNYTIPVPFNTPKSYVVTRVQAHDKDLLENGSLTFSILKGNKDMFNVDTSNGAVTVIGDPSSNKDIKQYNLTIIVKDKGKPQRNATAFIRIFFTPSKFSSRDDLSAFDSKGIHIGGTPQAEEAAPNFTIVIAVACGSTVVIVTLIVCIILLSCRSKERRKPEQGKYNCRVEAQRMLNGKVDRPMDTHESSSSHSTPSITYSLGHPVTTQDEGYTVLNHDDSGRGISLMEYTPENTITGKPTKTWPQQKSETQVPGLTPSDQSDFSPKSPMTDKTSVDSTQQPRLSVCNSCVVTSENDRFATKLVPLTDKEIEIHKILKFLHSQQDDPGQDGQCSDSMSTSDSGKGASVTEDCETPSYSSKPTNKQVTFLNLPKNGEHYNTTGKNYPSQHQQTGKPGQMSTFSASSPQINSKSSEYRSRGSIPKSPVPPNETEPSYGTITVVPKKRHSDNNPTNYTTGDKRHYSPQIYNNKDSSQNTKYGPNKRQSIDQLHNNIGARGRVGLNAQKHHTLPLSSFKKPPGDKSIMHGKAVVDEDNVSLNDNLSDVDTASTMSGSYVLAQDDSSIRIDLNRLRDTVV